MKPFKSIRGPSAGVLSEVSPSSAKGLPSWRVSRLLQHLARAVGRPRIRQVGKRASNEMVAERVRLKQVDLEALERLRRVAVRRCRSSSRRKKGADARCPRCGENEARPLAALHPGVVLECLGCGEVWKEVPKYA